jgi:hypothetical protein
MAVIAGKMKTLRHKKGNPTLFSVIDSVAMAGGFKPNYAAKLVSRLFAKDCGMETKCPHICFEGPHQKPTPAADLDTIFAVIALCGGRTGKQFLVSSAALVRRYLASDVYQMSAEMNGLNSVQGNFLLDEARKLTEEKRASYPQELDPIQEETQKERVVTYRDAMDAIRDQPFANPAQFAAYNNTLNCAITGCASTQELMVSRGCVGGVKILPNGKKQRVSGRSLFNNKEMCDANEANKTMTVVVPVLGFYKSAGQVCDLVKSQREAWEKMRALGRGGVRE